MKANRKLLLKNDEAVSPVIAVILMVAITVVLAATVYVWVSGFGGTSTTPAKTISLSSADALDTGTPNLKEYVVAGASPGLKYEDMSLTIDGATYTFISTGCTPATTQWTACAGTTTRASTALVTAGDIITVAKTSGLSGTTMRVLDTDSNQVIFTITVS